MEDKKLYFCSYEYCMDGKENRENLFSVFQPGSKNNWPKMDTLWEEAITYPMVNKTGSHYTPNDNWAHWLGKMNTYRFEDISFFYGRPNEEWIKETKVFSNSTPGLFIVNAFTLVQARNILLANIKYYKSKRNEGLPNEGKPDFLVRDIKFKIGESHLGFKSGEGGDCDPKTWGWDRYFNVVNNKLAFERDLIPRGKEEFFANYRNAVEVKID
jgi:hypothetical protein